MGTIQDKINQLHQSIAIAEADAEALAKQLCQVGGTLFNDTDADGHRGGGESVTGVRKIILQPGNITAASDIGGNYTIANLDPGDYQITRPDFPPGYRLSNPTAAAGNCIHVSLAAGEHKTIDIGTTNKPVSNPVAAAVASAPTAAPVTIAFSQVDAAASDDPPQRWPAIGACITLAVDAKDEPAAITTVAKATSLGLTHLRAFGPSCRTGGGLDTGYANAARRLTSRGLRVVVMHGGPENDPSHTTYAEDDWRRYFAAVAAARNNSALYEIELQNELNLPSYWPLGGGGVLCTAAVAKMLVIARIARAALGAAATIIGPSIGWNAGPQPHLLYQKAMLDAGLLDYVNAINTHLYFASAAQVTEVLGQYRQWVGPTGKIYVTETNCGIGLSAFQKDAAAIVNAVHAAEAIPIVYRLLPRGDSNWDDRCLFDRQGAKNTPVATAWLA